MPQPFPPFVSEPECVDTIVRFTGAGAANPTKNLGKGVAITWISTGLYEVTWSDFPGIYAGFYGWAFEATTAADLKGYTAVAGNYSASTKKLRVSVTNASESLTDLTSTRTLGFVVKFKQTSA